ncbi:unnamed protein product [Vicia faba]|uniref:Uncharacterized protein n=1 Tax=Vicia faba TaxID=3906 RepID=A0AAV1BCY3_VICFA|nr:unnamed protein product [Vicia faba]
MASRSSAPEIDIKAEYCPEAVIEWYRLTGLEDRKESLKRKDLALKAKQHLVYLKWEFWYVNKKGKWELRYTSPLNRKNYISLRKACESCIQDGGCSAMQSSTSVQVPSTTIFEDGGSITPSVTIPSSPLNLKKRVRDFGEIDQSTFNEDPEAFTSFSLQKCDVTTIPASKVNEKHVSTCKSQVTNSLPPYKRQKVSNMSIMDKNLEGCDQNEKVPNVSILEDNSQVFGKREDRTFVSWLDQNEKVSNVSILEDNSQVFGKREEQTFVSWLDQNEKVPNVSILEDNSQVFGKREERTSVSWLDQNEKVSNVSILEDNSQVFGKREERTFVSWLDQNEKVPNVSILEDNSQIFGKREERTFVSWLDQNEKVSNVSILEDNSQVFGKREERTFVSWLDQNEKVPNVSILEDNSQIFGKREERTFVSWLDQNEKVSNVSILEDNSQVFGKREERTFVWLVKNRVLVPGTNVFCRGSNNIVKIGSIVFDGIVCDCCHDHFNIIGFQTHAGCIRNTPSASIMLEDGRSLLECQREALNLTLPI